MMSKRISPESGEPLPSVVPVSVILTVVPIDTAYLRDGGEHA
jgi:hypothetical protein